PIGLIDENTRLIQDVKKGELLTYDMLEMDTTTTIYRLRALQDREMC
ncbi:MAG: NAD(P)-dependent oxidoreductase, partial [Tissierellia bacterium]|nr:NAD(P)-dependent oxidoreductase [Tissierellia bacterium]